MEKLEKALNKARCQRMHSLGLKNNELSSIHNPAFTPASSPIELGESFLKKNHIISYHTRSQEADVFRILRTQILQIMNQSGFKTLGITSPRYGDGKTTIALNLAVSIAQDLKQTVLLVDVDLRKPSVAEYLGIVEPLGISDYCLQNTPVSECIIRTSFERLSILPAGYSLDASSEVLGSPRMTYLAEELKTRYSDRLIIYDMPPVLNQDDPIAFLPNIDAFIMVIRNGVTLTSDIKNALNLLSGANLIGTVLNDYDKSTEF
ncbi:MAG: CpsD/CapB family tyrosine-protein kinase [Pseudomonadota bacterium]